jgi:hypothetical protein
MTISYHAFSKEPQARGTCLSNLGYTLRSEQEDAVTRALRHFGTLAKDGTYTISPQQKQFLWNAKMRFGKTLCSLDLVRRMNARRVLIVTHRPVVDSQWYDEFRDKVFVDKLDTWSFGSKSEKDGQGNYYDLEKFVRQPDHHYIFFASLQYLRRSTLVGEENDDDDQLKKDILNTDWDLVIVDEAHEGTRTHLGQNVIDYLRKSTTKMLFLSGTPFNLYSDFNEKEIFTWDYIQEQQAKRDWPQKHSGEPNPYADLPQMKIFTYDLGKLFDDFVSEGASFKFSEFFRTYVGQNVPKEERGKFVHEEAVNKFLDMLCEESPTSNYPFSKENYQEAFHHTLWVVPGVKEAAALKDLLEHHEVFSNFDIINVAGNSADDEEREDALDRVKNAIGEQPENTYTITISCGRLTTGVTIRPWTAVLYMKGTEMTSASTYMQTIFRVQSPATIAGKMKTECYVFDFAPDRSLKMIAETSKFSSHAKKVRKKNDEGEILTQEERDKETMKEFVSLCPVIALEGGTMKEFDVDKIYKQLEKVYIDRLVLNGFNDNCLYNPDELMKIDADELNKLGAKIAESTNMEKPKKATPNITLALNQLTPEQKAALEEARCKARENRKNKKDPYEGLTQEEIDAIEAEKERKKKEREEREKRISNIRGIALRIPLMMYGGSEAGDPNEAITVENFTRKIKDESWQEFMPRGITKQDFNYVRRVFNATRFEEAGKRYRMLAREADDMPTEDRLQRIADIFACFHNPDKETVLTPWRVVNMHLSDTLGGYCFFNEKFDGPNQKVVEDEQGKEKEVVTTNEPRFVDRGEVTKKVFEDIDENNGHRCKILEINSKTGLYPLYVTYSLFRKLTELYVEQGLYDDRNNISVEEEHTTWDDIVAHNIFVICNTPMAARITQRTLFGFRPIQEAHIKPIKLIERATTDRDALVADIRSPKFWKLKNVKEDMKFTAIVGNPPYQVMDGGAGASATPVYNNFVDVAKRLAPQYISMIIPAKWYTDGKGLESFRTDMLNDKRIAKITDFTDSRDCFENVDIAGGICFFLWDSIYHGNCEFCSMHHGTKAVALRDLSSSGNFIRDIDALSIIEKVTNQQCVFYNTKVSSRKPFGLATNVKPLKTGDIL